MHYILGYGYFLLFSVFLIWRWFIPGSFSSWVYVFQFLYYICIISVSLCISSWSASLRSSCNPSSSIILPLYSCLQPKSDGSPHFLLLWRILLVPSIWGEYSKREAPLEFLKLRKGFNVGDSTSGDLLGIQSKTVHWQDNTCDHTWIFCIINPSTCRDT